MMLEGDALTKLDFSYLTDNQMRMIIQRYVKNDEMIDELMELYKERCITGFQLKDILSETNNFDEIKKKLTKQFNLEILGDPRLYKQLEEKESEDELKERMGHPAVEPMDLLMECELEDFDEAVNKLSSNRVTTYLFWQLSEGDFEDKLGIKLFGEKK